jgi:hypothetical protein
MLNVLIILVNGRWDLTRRLKGKMGGYIKMDLKETEIHGFGQRQLADSCEGFNVSSVYKNAEYFFTS